MHDHSAGPWHRLAAATLVLQPCDGCFESELMSHASKNSQEASDEPVE